MSELDEATRALLRVEHKLEVVFEVLSFILVLMLDALVLLVGMKTGYEVASACVAAILTVIVRPFLQVIFHQT